MQHQEGKAARGPSRRRVAPWAAMALAGLFAGGATADEVSSGSSADLDAYRPLAQSAAASGTYFNQIVGIGIAGSNDHVYAWYADGTVSSGTTKDLGAYRARQSYTLPAGYHTSDIVGMAIAGSNDHVYAFYRNGMVSSGTSTNLAAYRAPYAYRLPPGKDALSIVGIGIAGSDDHVWVWYADGTVSSGTTSDFEVYRKVQPFRPAAGKRPDQIAGIAIAGSDDHVYAWYADCNPGSIGTLLQLRNAPQETGQWCWAASGQMTMGYVGNVTVPQCTQANARFGRSDCCNSPRPAGCVSPGWPEFGRYSFAHRESGALSWPEVKKELAVGGSCRGRPFVFSWGWLEVDPASGRLVPSDTGHAMVAMGFSSVKGKGYVHVQDPWPPNVGTYSIVAYDFWVQDPNDHVHWTDFSDITYTGGK